MSDSDKSGDAWLVPPSDYLASRPPQAPADPPRSLYLTMRDGCRLAADVYLSPGGGSVPAILILTPYYRRFAVTSSNAEAAPGVARWRDLFVPRGYVLVAVDVRGTGASFGTRDSFRSPRERDDYREIADWIVAQPWSDGRIGATGISYVGAACDFLASTGHEAVRAIAPLFAVWDTWMDHFFPGGLQLDKLARNYDALMLALDQDRREMLGRFAYFNDPHYAGPQPVDGDHNGALRDAAVREHRGNFRMPNFLAEFRFRDDALAHDPAFTPDAFSPCHYSDRIREDVAVYAVSGWMDGAGYTNSAIARFLTLRNPHRRLLIGPWDHGARTNVSPWRAQAAPQFSLDGELLRFFDQYLMQRDTGLAREAPVHYFACHAEAWRAAPQWPPARASTRLYLADGAQLTSVPPAQADRTYLADFGFGTGNGTRYERLAAFNTTEYYEDWTRIESALPSWRSASLPAAAELAGHAVLTLFIAASEADAALHIYLSEEEPDGTVRYVTEGVLRALHRKVSDPPPNYRTSWPYHSCRRADAAPLKPGEIAEIQIALLPTCWTFMPGSRIRLAIAGADADHYAQAPHGRPPTLRITEGGAHASRLDLPPSRFSAPRMTGV